MIPGVVSTTRCFFIEVMGGKKSQAFRGCAHVARYIEGHIHASKRKKKVRDHVLHSTLA